MQPVNTADVIRGALTGPVLALTAGHGLSSNDGRDEPQAMLGITLQTDYYRNSAY